MSTPHIIWRDTPSSSFAEALPLGNGRLGAMVFGGVQTERLMLTEDTLWSGSPKVQTIPQAAKVLPAIRALLLNDHDQAAAGKLTLQLQGADPECFQLMGNLLLTFKTAARPMSYRHELSLNTAQVTTSYSLDGVDIRREAFISYPDQVLVLRMTAENGLLPNFTLTISSPLPVQLQASDNRLLMQGHAPASRKAPADAAQENSASMSFAVQLLLQASEKATVTAGATALDVSGASDATVILSAATSFNGFAKPPRTAGKAPLTLLRQQFAKIQRYSYDDLLSRHRADIVPRLSACSLDLTPDRFASTITTQRLLAKAEKTPSPALAALLFNYSRYLMLSTSRPGTQPATLQGLWTDGQPDSRRVCCPLDLETEMTYWSAGPANLLECTDPLLHLADELRKTGSLIASVNYGLHGWCAHQSTDIWRLACPDGDFGRDRPPRPCWPLGGVWLSLTLWDHALYAPDPDILRRKIWPIIKGAAQFAMDWLVPYRSNLVTAPSSGMEYTSDPLFAAAGFRPGIASTQDMSLIRELLLACLDISERLSLKGDITIRTVRKVLPLLMPPSPTPNGLLREWPAELDIPDNGQAQAPRCFTVFPGYDSLPETLPELKDACRKTIMEMPSSNDITLPWQACLQARIGNGNLAWKVLGQMLRPASSTASRTTGLLPNLLHYHEQCRLSGNFGMAAAIAEMIVHSHRIHDGHPVIDLLPALPDDWPDGAAHGFLLRGGATLDILWKQHRLVSAQLMSSHAMTCLVSASIPLSVTSCGEAVPAVLDSGILAFDMSAGREYTLAPAPITAPL